MFYWIQFSNKGVSLSTSKVLVCQDVIFNESDFHYDPGKTEVTDGRITTGHEQVMVPEDEESIELPNGPQPKEQVVQEHQHRYPRR